MAKRRAAIRQAPIVGRFAARLREVRVSRGFTQVELARKARVATAYVWRLEQARTAPGIDLVEKLAAALGTTVADLLPSESPPDTDAVLREQARALSQRLIEHADRTSLLMLNPLLARLAERSRD
jgi:transcriptional regulator with XRE-family HTH domain